MRQDKRVSLGTGLLLAVVALIGATHAAEASSRAQAMRAPAAALR